MEQKHIVVTFSCPDHSGIQADTTALLRRYDANLTEVASYSDEVEQRFFSRLAVSLPATHWHSGSLQEDWRVMADSLSMQWQMHEQDECMPVIIAVSRELHCLNDLLYRVWSADMNIKVVAVVSNHDVARPLTEHYGIPFYHVPITQSQSKLALEEKMNSLAEKNNVELIVLARYMQIMSPEFCDAWQGRCINIHHSFLPSFKGAYPYQQAYDRGVKVIGASAHYVTSDLDEGPIISQDVEAVRHNDTPLKLRSHGRDIETRVLASAVRWHSERRIFVDGIKTVVFN